jgi:hypothetical protein
MRTTKNFFAALMITLSVGSQAVVAESDTTNNTPANTPPHGAMNPGMMSGMNPMMGMMNPMMGMMNPMSMMGGMGGMNAMNPMSMMGGTTSGYNNANPMGGMMKPEQYTDWFNQMMKQFTPAETPAAK